MEKLKELLKKMVDEEFFGELLIKFEKGKIAIMRQTKTIKP